MHDFKQICSIPSNKVDNLYFVIDPHKKPPSEHARKYNVSLSEVSVMRTTAGQPAQLVLQRIGVGIQVIPETHRAKDALHFVLFFPFGSDGWHPELKQK